ncbi:MAG: tetratricopeptide repeat protein [Leptolyngbya sp. SIO1D8]|nr:tetratricopeptide repeat protein [Leptolyngbya sp. SIO1D8]
MLEQLGHYHQALVSYQRAVTARPDNTLALAHQCAVLNELEQFEAAIAACDAAFQGNNLWDGIGPAYGWSQTSAAQIGLGEYEAALASANRAIALNADYLGGWNNKAVSLWHLQDYEEALQSITIDRETPAPEPFMFQRRRQVLMASNQGLILYAMERYQHAIAAYSTAIALQQLGQNYLGEAGTLVDADFMARVWVNLANAQLAERQLAQATVSARTATQQSHTTTDAWYTLALTHFAEGNYDAAWVAYQQAAQLQPERIDILMGQALTLKQAGCTQEAFQVFGALLNLDPSNPVARREYRNLLQEQQQPIAADADTDLETTAPDTTEEPKTLIEFCSRQR